MNSQNNNHEEVVLKLFGSLAKPVKEENPDVPESVKRLLQLTKNYQKEYQQK